MNHDQTYKQKLLNTGLFRKVSDEQYRMQDCPFCGDHKYHFYVKITMDDTPVLYKCFKCDASGILNKKILDYYDLDNIELPKTIMRKRIDTGGNISNEVKLITVNEMDDIQNICQYIHERVGHIPSLEDLQTFQYVGKPDVYAKEYLGMTNQMYRVLQNRYWFRLTNGNIIGRYKNDNTDFRWLRFHSNRIKTKGLYIMKNPIDLYQPIHVYLAEGIMDCIGLYYHFSRPNTIYIANLGKDYDAGIQYLINLGIFGNSVTIHFFKDQDVSLKQFQNKYHYIRLIFKQINIYQNAIGHDYGVLSKDIEIEKLLSF